MTIIIFSFPSICFSESKTVVGEDCQTYLGNMKNKKELGEFRKSVREKSIKLGLVGLLELKRDEDFDSLEDCFPEIIRKIISHQYLEKVVVISHTEKGRKICDKVRITSDPEVIEKYLIQEKCLDRSKMTQP